jgi:hypothetical protein
MAPTFSLQQKRQLRRVRRPRTRRTYLPLAIFKICCLLFGLSFVTYSIILLRSKSEFVGSSSRSSLRTPWILTYEEKLQAAKRDFGNDRYLLFTDLKIGQGTGNIMAGLLAAHLLGDEFGRTVCVHKTYKEFHLAFEAAHPEISQNCPAIVNEIPFPTADQFAGRFVRLVNFGRPPDECALQKLLASDHRVILLEANTYPRWSKVPDNYFFRFYRPRQELLQILPYQTAPHTVVHLRAPDGEEDKRKGLDPKSLQSLGVALPRDTYLVCNRVEWYTSFERDFGWSHPNWHTVVHSALRITWGTRQEYKDPDEGRVSWAFNQDKATRIRQTLQMFADWYTILTAQKVYHTHSDFSVSAIHWQNIDSRSIAGYNIAEQRLVLSEESWRIEGDTPRLVDRRLEADGIGQLRLCNAYGADRDPLAAFDDDDERLSKKKRIPLADTRAVPGAPTPRGAIPVRLDVKALVHAQ